MLFIYGYSFTDVTSTNVMYGLVIPFN